MEVLNRTDDDTTTATSLGFRDAPRLKADGCVDLLSTLLFYEGISEQHVGSMCVTCTC